MSPNVTSGMNPDGNSELHRDGVDVRTDVQEAWHWNLLLALIQLTAFKALLHLLLKPIKPLYTNGTLKGLQDTPLHPSPPTPLVDPVGEHPE